MLPNTNTNTTHTSISNTIKNKSSHYIVNAIAPTIKLPVVTMLNNYITHDDDIK
jgi:hypothetical protein